MKITITPCYWGLRVYCQRSLVLFIKYSVMVFGFAFFKYKCLRVL